MAKGKSTTVIAFRLPDGVYTMLQTEAAERGLSVSEMVRLIVEGKLTGDSVTAILKRMRPGLSVSDF